jgi:predicted short-subunit dehydrogenase-like oxidoreductase (DUF2520 family)
MDSISFIGAGRLGATLARAFARHGLPVRFVASRSHATAAHVAAQVPGSRAIDAAQAAQADLVFLTVPDDAIAALAQRLPWRAGQAVDHCSGATELSVLDAAARAGASIGGFHPLQIFADPDVAIEQLAGSTVAIEGDARLTATLRGMAERLQMRSMTLPPGARALYHGGASFAASVLLSMLDEAVDVWGGFGIAPDQALQALLPLARGTLEAAARKGLAGALAGPVSRGDAGVVQRHHDAFARLGAEHLVFYREMTRRQLRLADAGGRLDGAQRQALADAAGLD